MSTPTDAQLHAEAERRSVRAQPELELTDAVWWLTHDALVPPEHINGLVLDGEVYDVRAHTEHGVCTKPAEHRSDHCHAIIRAERAAADVMAHRIRQHGGCGQVTTRTVAATGWEAAR